MTEPPSPRRRLPRPPSAKPVAMSVLVLFAAVLALLAVQMRAGRDPALGAEVKAAPRPGRSSSVASTGG